MDETLKQKLKAYFAAQTLDAGEDTGYCETCSSFEFTGFSLATLNTLIDNFDPAKIN